LIGGPGKIVEINEFSYRKKKHSRSRKPPFCRNIWVFGAFERASNICLFFVLKYRKKEATIELIIKHVARGSIVYLDVGKACKDILKEDKSLRYLMANYELEFVDTKTGFDTNNIKSIWKNCEMKIKHMCGKSIKFRRFIFSKFFLSFSC
jgi:hypothetical protein